MSLPVPVVTFPVTLVAAASLTSGMASWVIIDRVLIIFSKLNIIIFTYSCYENMFMKIT